MVDRLGYENDLINNVEHVTLKNNFDYQTYHKQQEDKELKSKQVEEQEFENQKILNQAKKIQDEKDRKQKEQEEQLRLAKLEEETKIAEAKKLLEESEKKEEVIKLSNTIKNPEIQKSKNNKLAYLIFGSPVLTVGIAGVFFFTSSSNKLDQNTHQTAQNELQTISELYTSAINKEKIDPTQYISTKLNDQLSKNTSLETSKDDSTYNLTMGTGKSAEHISIKDSISPFDKNTPNELNKTHIEIKYQLPQIDGDSCFGLVKNLATTMQNINSITINNTEITKQDHTDHGVIINNDKVFQTCTDGTKELTINLGKID